jgi:hypothetical protein
MRWHLSASLLLHAIVLSLMLFFARPPAANPTGETSVHIVIVPAVRPRQPPLTGSRPLSTPTKSDHPSPLTAARIIAAARHAIVPGEAKQSHAPTPNPSTQLTTASRLYSAALLAGPHNRSARQAMNQLAPDERIIQLCNVEAMAQVRHANPALKPDYVIAYALTDLQIADHQLVADGGAFLSHRNWYALAFRCTVSADRQRVASFAYRVGSAVPKALWAAHNLTDDASSAD